MCGRTKEFSSLPTATRSLPYRPPTISEELPLINKSCFFTKPSALRGKTFSNDIYIQPSERGNVTRIIAAISQHRTAAKFFSLPTSLSLSVVSKNNLNFGCQIDYPSPLPPRKHIWAACQGDLGQVLLAILNFFYTLLSVICRTKSFNIKMANP